MFGIFFFFLRLGVLLSVFISIEYFTKSFYASVFEENSTFFCFISCSEEDAGLVSFQMNARRDAQSIQ